MQRRFHVLLAALLLGLCTCLAGKEPTSGANEEISQLVADLDSDQFQTRDNATRQLVALGPEVAETLAQAAKFGSRERTQRTLHILRQLGFSTELAHETAARSALQALSKSSQAVVARGATESLTAIDQFHQAPALDALKRLGAKVFFGQQLSQFGVFSPAGMIRNRIEFDENWKGQPADLKHLRRLVQLESITITGDTVTEMVFDDLVDLPKLVRVELQNVKFSDQSLAKLGSMKSVESLYIWYSPFTDKALPHLMNLKRAKHIQLWGTDMTESSVEKLRQAYLGIDLIFHRGALLGIESDQEPVDSGGCRVVRVTEGTAAATAGIRPGDTIISVDDTKIESFDVLKATMAKKKHGETVTIRIRRRDKELDLKTKLGEWSPALRPPFR